MVNCEKCYKYHNNTVLEKCNFCRDQKFREAVFCELLQHSQAGKKNIECFMYKPNLSIIGEEKIINNASQKNNEEHEPSNKHKWLKSYAMQQWELNSDQIFSYLNFHICLITKNRAKTFSKSHIDLSNIDMSPLCEILSFSEDHIHLYASISPDYSLDEVAKKIIISLSDKINNFLPDKENRILFEEIYFAESIG